MPRKPKSKSGEPDQDMNPRNSEESSMNKPRRSASMGEDVDETTYEHKISSEDDADEVDVTDDEDKDESSHRRK